MRKNIIIILVGLTIGVVFIPYTITLILALVTALLLEGLVNWFEKKFRLSRVNSVILAFISYILILIGIGYQLLKITIEQITSLSENTPTLVQDFYLSTLLPIIRQMYQYLETLPSEVVLSVENTIENSVNSLDSFLQTLFTSAFSLITAIPGFLIEFLIYLIALFLITLELPNLKKKLSQYLTTETKTRVSLVTNKLTSAGIGFIKAQIILSALTFMLAFVGLAVLGVSNKVLISLLIVIVDILPILGTGSVLVPWGIVAILQGDNFLGIGLIILFVVITVIRRTIEPKVYSTNLGISPLASLISLYIGFKLLGFIGLFAGPAVVIVFDTLRKANILKMNFKI